MKKKTNSKDNTDIIRELRLAYAMELENVQNYIANSVHLDGVRSDVIKKVLASDVATEVTHAQQLAHRIKTIGGRVPGSLELTRTQTYLQPPKDPTNIVAVIKGVITAEQTAITHYNTLIKLFEGRDYVTQELVIQNPRQRRGPSPRIRRVSKGIRAVEPGQKATQSCPGHATLQSFPISVVSRQEHVVSLLTAMTGS